LIKTIAKLIFFCELPIDLTYFIAEGLIPGLFFLGTPFYTIGRTRFAGEAVSFRPRGAVFRKRTQSFFETNAVFLKNDCVRFPKRRRSNSIFEALLPKREGGGKEFGELRGKGNGILWKKH